MTDDNFCRVCNKVPFKYSCPACNIKTCSIPCICSHKKLDNCSGKRSRTTFVSKSEYNVNTFVNDYWLLEDASQLVDRAAIKSHECFKLEKRSKSRKKTIDSVIGGRQGLKTFIRWLPVGFEKSQENKTRVSGRSHIEWYVCWILTFSSSSDTENHQEETNDNSLEDKNKKKYSIMSENDTIAHGFESLSVIPDHDHKSLPTSFEIINEPPGIAPFPIRIMSQCTLKEALLGVTVVEYPTIRVVFNN